MAAAACCLSLLLLPAIVLQTCAVFSPYWIKNNSTSECFRGLFYNSDCPDDVAGLGAAILGLQVIFFLLIFLTTVSSVYLFCCKGKDSDEGCCAKICGSVVLVSRVAWSSSLITEIMTKGGHFISAFWPPVVLFSRHSSVVVH